MSRGDTLRSSLRRIAGHLPSVVLRYHIIEKTRRIEQLENQIAQVSAATAADKAIQQDKIQRLNDQIGQLHADYSKEVSSLKTHQATLTAAAKEWGTQGAADAAAYQAAYAERVAELEVQIAALTNAARERETQAAADIAAYQQAYAERVGDLVAQIAGFAETASKREIQAAADIAAYQQAYTERVGDLGAQVTALTDAANQREARAAADIAALQQAYTERLSNLGAQIAALTDAANQREARAAADIAIYQQIYAARVGDLEVQTVNQREAQAAADISAYQQAYAERVSDLEAQAAANVTAYQQAYTERVGYLEAQIAALTDAANQREAQAAADIAIYQRTYAERVGDLEAQIIGYAEAASKREIQVAADISAQQRAYAQRVGDLEAQIAGYVEAASKREIQAAADIAAYQQAYAERVAELEAQITALVESAVRHEVNFQRKQELDYQLLMAHQQQLAGVKDLDPDFFEFYERCRPYTMTSIERLFALYKTIEYVCTNGIGGDLLECGVWRGGSCMLMALALLHHGSTDRRILMFDTFEGHPMPDAKRDIDIWGGRAIDEWKQREAAGTVGEWGFASIDEVRTNLISTGYPADRLVFIKGLVEATASENVPKSLAMLRLDTDWYDSTKVALDQFYPRLTPGGVLIIDDYGHYKGQKQAVDEYFDKIKELPLLQRVDYSCRIAVKSFRATLASPRISSPT